MTLGGIVVGIVFTAGAIAVAWLYARSNRGRSISEDMRRNRQLSLLWWRDPVFLRRHWPIIALIVLYTFAFGIIAVSLS